MSEASGTSASLFPLKVEDGWRANGRHETEPTVVIRAQDTELLASIGRNSSLIAVEIPLDRLTDAPFPACIATLGLTGEDRHLLDWLGSLIGAAENGMGLTHKDQMVVADLIAEGMMNRIAKVTPKPRPLTGSASLDLFRRLVHALGDTETETRDQRRLAAVLQVTLDDLRQAIADHTGMSPSRWLMLARLNLARRTLASSKTSAARTVSDVAMQHGFFHFGRFSTSYRQHFAQAPSATLRERQSA